MGLRTCSAHPTTPHLPSSPPSTNLSLPDALAAVTDAFSPWLAPQNHRTPARELRILSLTLTRLRDALATASRSSVTLFDRVATADATAALVELRDLAARARAASAIRPRIKIDWRTRDRHSPLFVAAANVAAKSLHNSSSPNSALRTLSLPHPAHSPALPAVAKPDPPFPSEERKRVEVVANRLDALLQVALWKRRFAFSSDRPIPNPHSSARPTAHNSFHCSSTAPGTGRPKFGRRGRVRSSAEASFQRPDTPARPPSTTAVQCISPSSTTGGSAPWDFSPIESPITPLRSRSLATVPDGSSVMAMWRGMRVSVKVIRASYSRFIREANYLYSLGNCPNIPSLLGAHWEQPPTHKKKHQIEQDSRLGYLVLEVVNGVSLDKLVRQSKLNDVVTKLRLLERIVASLMFAQKLNPVLTHQDLHPGNILLVPIEQDLSFSASNPKLGADYAPIIISGLHSSPKENPGFVRSSTNSTVGTSTDASLPKHSSNSSLIDSIPIAEPADSIRSPTCTDGSKSAMCSPVPNNLNNLEYQSNHASKSATGSLSNQPNTLSQNPFPNRQTATFTKEFSRNTYLNGQPHTRSPVSDPSSPPPPLNTSNQSQSALDATLSPPMFSVSTESSFIDDDKDYAKRKSGSTSTASAFTVKVMDFPQVDEADGMRRLMTWETNEALSGYCPPEKVTPSMHRRLQSRLERERERKKRIADAKIGSGVREAVFVSSSDRKTRPHFQDCGQGARHRSDIAYRGVIDKNEVSEHLSRVSSAKHRQTPDSETYALFGGDDLVDLRPTDAESGDLESDSLVEVELDGKNIWERYRSTDEEMFDETDSTRTWEGYSKLKDGAGDTDHGRRLNIQYNQIRGVTGNSNADVRRKIDVWSIGWLLYYMCMEQHPVRDAWARICAITELELKELPVECRDIVKMCVEPDIDKRAELRDVKRVLDSTLQKLMFTKGIHLLNSDRKTAFVLLDKAVGIQTTKGERNRNENDAWNSSDTGDSNREEVIGLNQITRTALSALPAIVVRRVEWEAAGLYFGLCNDDMQKLRHSLVRYKWNKNDIGDGSVAIQYLQRHCKEGVSSAQSALGWVYRWGGGGVKKDVRRAIEVWEQAVENGKDAEACNGLGLLFHHGREEVKVDGKRARKYYEMAVDQDYPAAAVNLGVLLHDGAGGVEADGKAAKMYYEIACQDGDGVAANNLGLLLHHGGKGVEVDGNQARAAYEMAIVRNERHHACRNLGELLWNGAKGVDPDRHLAVDYFAMAMSRGDSSSRALACSWLRRLVLGAKEEIEGQNDKYASELRDILYRCDELLKQVKSLDRARRRV